MQRRHHSVQWYSMTIITSFCYHCITAQHTVIPKILVGTKFILAIGGFESNHPTFRLSKLHSVMSPLLHNHNYSHTYKHNCIAETVLQHSHIIPNGSYFLIEQCSYINCKALHQYLCATTLHGHNAMTKQ